MGVKEVEIYKIEEKIKKLELIKKRIEEDDKKENRDIFITVFNSKINNYKNRLDILKTDEKLKDEEIALVNKNNSIEGKYFIYRIFDAQRVGYITYSPEEEQEIGSIGYSVLGPFRGKEYAYKSLLLLSDYLSNNGVDKISIMAESNNIPSVKTMEKFKKEVSSTDESKDGIKRYIYRINQKNE